MRLRHATLLVLLLSGCPRPLPPALNAATVKPGDLPEDREELLRYADSEMQKDNIASAENSLVAIEKAIGAHALTVIARDYAALWRAARACAWLAEEFNDNQTREQFAYHGMRYAKAAALLQPKRVEGHYYLGINTGWSASTEVFGAYPMVPRVRDEAKAAIKADETFDHAGPLRLLGGVFAKAPPWPASVGDLEEGLKYLSRAVAVAGDYPENHLFYGDALFNDQQRAQALHEYQLVLETPERPEYSHRLGRWKRTAASGLQKMHAAVQPSPRPPAPQPQKTPAPQPQNPPAPQPQMTPASTP